MHITKVRDAMTASVVTLAPSDTIHEAAGLLSETGVSGAPVVDGGKLIGMLTESDIVRVVAPVLGEGGRNSLLDLLTGRAHVVGRGLTGPTVRDAMAARIWTIAPTASIWEAASEMRHRGVKRLPVVDEDGMLVGIISQADVVRTVGRSDAAIRAEIAAAVAAIAAEVGSDTLVDVDVAVRDGSVTISGRAGGRWAKGLATEVAALTPGAFSVRDNVKVGGARPV